MKIKKNIMYNNGDGKALIIRALPTKDKDLYIVEHFKYYDEPTNRATFSRVSTTLSRTQLRRFFKVKRREELIVE